ncbi:MAG: hypothetical protein DRP02_11870 [Candidatus Gerdarchaeota archaeon]|nr:MAG: hypothetical protein DRP02_11870 [Candidatus Gerdarchaeota archaeon]
MEKITKITLFLVWFSMLFDLATTEYLLSIGQIQKNGVTISFYEQNPLFHMLGHELFVLVMLLTTVLITFAVYRYDRLCVKQGDRRVLTVGCLGVIMVFAVPHIFLGLNNLSLLFYG